MFVTSGSPCTRRACGQVPGLTHERPRKRHTDADKRSPPSQFRLHRYASSEPEVRPAAHRLYCGDVNCRREWRHPAGGLPDVTQPAQPTVASVSTAAKPAAQPKSGGILRAALTDLPTA